VTENVEQAHPNRHQKYLRDWAQIPPVVGLAISYGKCNSNVRLAMEAAQGLGAVLSFIQTNCQKEKMNFEHAVAIDHDLTALLIEIKSLPHTSLPTRCAAGLTTCLRYGSFLSLHLIFE
jgi:hypothetical protein